MSCVHTVVLHSHHYLRYLPLLSLYNFVFSNVIPPVFWVMPPPPRHYGDRQRQCDGLQKLPFRLFVETLPVMLLLALLLAYGLGKYMASINATVAGVLVALTQLGDLFYIGIVIVGASSYECPFQTPASVPLHSLWMKIRPYLIPITPPIITTLHVLGELTQCHILHVMMHLPHVDVQQSSRSFWGGFSSESFSHVFASRGQGWISAAISATLFCR